MFRGIESKVHALQDEIERLKRESLDREIKIDRFCELDGEIAAHLAGLERALVEISRVAKESIPEVKAELAAIFQRVEINARLEEPGECAEFHKGELVWGNNDERYVIDSILHDGYVILKDRMGDTIRFPEVGLARTAERVETRDIAD